MMTLFTEIIHIAWNPEPTLAQFAWNPKPTGTYIFEIRVGSTRNPGTHGFLGSEHADPWIFKMQDYILDFYGGGNCLQKKISFDSLDDL